MTRIEKLCERLILPLAIVALAVSATVLFTPAVGVAVFVGAAWQRHDQRQRERYARREAQLLRRVRSWRVYG